MSVHENYQYRVQVVVDDGVNGPRYELEGDTRIANRPTSSLLTRFYERTAQDLKGDDRDQGPCHVDENEHKDVSRRRRSKDQEEGSSTKKKKPKTRSLGAGTSGANRCTGHERERRQRVLRDRFRKKVVELAFRWMRFMDDDDAAGAKQDVVVNEEQRYTTRPSALKQRDRVDNDDGAYDEDRLVDQPDHLFKRQNGYFYYNILCTSDIESLLMAAASDGIDTNDDEEKLLIIKLAFAADLYLRVMYNADIRPSVFIKFDDRGSPFLFARQTKRSPDTCVTGPPGEYWTKTLHLDSPAKTSQHVALQRVRSGRLIQDSTFVVLGKGRLEDMPEYFTSPSLRCRKLFKELYKYITSVPEIDLSLLGRETINEHGILDPIKMFLPRMFDTEDKPADDVAFVNYVDMFVTMVANMLNLERRKSTTTRLLKVYRTEYKFELAGRKDHPGVYFFRNAKDYITDVCMVNGEDSLLDEDKKRFNIQTAYEKDGGVYFYDVKLVKDVEMKLVCRGHTTDATSKSENFYKHVFSECDDVKEMICYAKSTIDVRLNDALKEDLYIRLHETDPSRYDTTSCLDTQLDGFSVRTNMSDYRTTYYIYKSNTIKRVLDDPPRGLESSDCVLRAFRLKWVGKEREKYIYTMYPCFAVVFKNVSVYEITNGRNDGWKVNGGEFTFPEKTHFEHVTALVHDARTPERAQAYNDVNRFKVEPEHMCEGSNFIDLQQDTAQSARILIERTWSADEDLSCAQHRETYQVINADPGQLDTTPEIVSNSNAVDPLAPDLHDEDTSYSIINLGFTIPVLSL